MLKLEEKSDYIMDVTERCERAEICPDATDRCKQAISHLARLSGDKLICHPKRRWMYCHSYYTSIGMVFDKELGFHILPETRKMLIRRAKPHAHAQWVGSDLACGICNPVCWQNHGFGKDMAFKDCGNPKCPNRGAGKIE